MEIIRKTPGKVYYKSNTSVAIKLLAFLAVVLVLLVLGVCIFVIFGLNNNPNYYLDDAQVFYYSVNDENKTAKFELYIGKDAREFTIPDCLTHQGITYRITEIGAEAFTNNQKLTAVKIGDNVERVAGNTTQKTGAFSGCVNLQSIKLGNNVRHIDNYAFKNCLNLTALDLPSSVQFVGTGSFMYNLNLATVRLNSSNTQLDPSSFQFCNAITTLALANDVIVDNDKKQALAALPNLQTFVLSEDNSHYQVQDNCLIDQSGTTLVLGGKSAGVVDLTAITAIADWAFGNRYGSDDIFLSGNVEMVGVNAFTAGVIYTDEPVKPATWQTKLPVRCEAQKVAFHRGYDGDDSVDAYVFKTDPTDDKHYRLQGDTYYPTWETLFGEPDGEHVFAEWGVISEGECTAVYEDGTLATEADLASLSGAISQADTYLQNENKRLEFTLAFWENFKSAYGTAKAVQDKGNSALGYEAKNATKNLQFYLTELAKTEHDSSIIVDTNDWRKGLGDLLSRVEVAMANRDDFVENIDAWTSIDSTYVEAKERLANQNCDDAQGKSAWRVLRKNYEELQVRFADDTPLSQLIHECSALQSADYTAESWETFTAALTKARAITPYNMSVSQVRMDLRAAKENLVENNLASYEQMVELAAWLAVCQDLPANDYTSTSYDQLLLAYNRVIADIDNIDTVTEVDTAIKSLRSTYHALTPLAKKPTESGGNAVTKSLVPYFVVALILFTVAVIIQAVATTLKKSQRSKKHE